MIPFTQYLRPNGERRAASISRPTDIENKAKDLISAGAVFEIEELSNGIISMTCELGEETLGHELCRNDVSVKEAVDRLVLNSETYIQGLKLEK